MAANRHLEQNYVLMYYRQNVPSASHFRIPSFYIINYIISWILSLKISVLNDKL